MSGVSHDGGKCPVEVVIKSYQPLCAHCIVPHPIGTILGFLAPGCPMGEMGA